jgi:uncharacterized protein
MDITPLIPKGRQLIQAYGAGGFVIADERYSGNIIVQIEHTAALPVAAFEALTLDDLAALWAEGANVELLLIGCGPTMVYVPDSLRAGLKAHGMTVDGMDTGAACRTYNVLLSEERRVAAVLFAVE